MRWIVALRRLNYIRKFRRRHQGTPVPSEIIYYLHIGKTGGTFFKSTVKDFDNLGQEPVLMIPLGHNLKHQHLPKESRYIFATRDPMTRFVSGFLSRQRRVAESPSKRKWGERRAFATFPTPNALAEGLSAQDVTARRAAEAAMRAIRHVNEPHSLWFPDRDRLADDIANGRVFRLRQEHLNADMRAILDAIGFDVAPEKLEARPRAHVAPEVRAQGKNAKEENASLLSPQAQENLRVYYADDFAFFAWLVSEGLVGASALPYP